MRDQPAPRPRRRDSQIAVREEAVRQRQATNPAEHALWEALRERRFRGLKFRRQHPLGRFILDFYCVDHRLAVEVDGGAHLGAEARERDAARDAWLGERGVRVVRVPAALVLSDLPAALAAVELRLGRVGPDESGRDPAVDPRAAGPARRQDVQPTNDRNS